MSTDYAPSDVQHDTIQIPSDGDDEDEASIAPALEALADNAFHARLRYGKYRLISDTIQGQDFDDVFTVWGNTLGNSNTYGDLQTGIVTPEDTIALSDIVVVQVDGTLRIVASAAGDDVYYVQLRDTQDGGSTFLDMPHARKGIITDHSAGAPSNLYIPFTLRGRRVVTSAAGAYNVKIQGRTTNALSSQQIEIVGSVLVHCQVWRPN